MDLRASIKKNPEWVVLGVIFAAISSFIIYEFLSATVLSIFFYYVARPLNSYLRNYLPTRTIPAIVSISAVLLPVVGVLSFTLLVLAEELNVLSQTLDYDVVQSILSPYLAEVSPSFSIDEFVRSPIEVITAQQLEVLRSISTVLLGYAGGVIQAFININIILLVGFYLLRDGSTVREKVERHVESKTLESYANRVDRDMKAVFFGNVLNALITGIIGSIVYIGFSVFTPLPMKYPALLGLLCGIASLIPIVGMKLVYIPYTAGLVLQAPSMQNQEYYWYLGLFIVFSAIIVDAIPDTILRPYVSARGMGIGLMVIAYTVGPVIFGWYGIFLGPVIFILIYNFAKVVLPAMIEHTEANPPYYS